ncbi:DUF2103 domain-containing protein [Desulfosporosinus sp. BG]|uniref:DUF2103 domain-containing protein n=1 Tax=Desulfosporosinus sp. BG TaxID=1633135 RepID=UPI00083B8FE0|nr:DUF2103 domain-containing protein [Desulfosporosinus sp. BG]ODA39397.1 hypothetical protein DSBG_3835 [Desulfosporosinus sp. BG]
MKHRRNKVKREHGIIQNALLWLENLGCLGEVTDIIPGVIEVSHSSERGIVYKYETQTGCKLLLKSNGSIQEVFVVTKNPACVQEWVKKEFPSDALPLASNNTSARNQQSPARKKLSNVPQKSRHEEENQTSTRGLHHPKKHSYRKGQRAILGDQNSPNVAERLDLATLKALSHLKKSLENIRVQDAKAKFKNSLQK